MYVSHEKQLVIFQIRSLLIKVSKLHYCYWQVRNEIEEKFILLISLRNTAQIFWTSLLSGCKAACSPRQFFSPVATTMRGSIHNSWDHPTVTPWLPTSDQKWRKHSSEYPYLFLIRSRHVVTFILERLLKKSELDNIGAQTSCLQSSRQRNPVLSRWWIHQSIVQFMVCSYNLNSIDAVRHNLLSWNFLAVSGWT